MPRRRNLGWWIAKRLFWVLRSRPIRRFVNREYTDFLASSTPPRPHGYSLWGPDQDISDYVSWPSLTDHAFSARHLPPAKQALPIPATPTGDVQDATTELWRRGKDMIVSPRSSVLFAFFAQWFTDSILRIDPNDRRRNTSTHNIDLCQIYGLTEATTRILRSQERGQKGELAHRKINGQEYPDLLCEASSKDGPWSVKQRYRGLPWAQRLKDLLGDFDESRLSHFYATGLERGNSSIGYTSVSTLFLREHNRLSRELSRRNKEWSDERVFQTARCINIVILLKLLLEEYINHILGEKLFLLEPCFADRRSWLRANWITVEFDLLYRWHGLVPETLEIGAASLKPAEFRNNNSELERLGVEKVISGTSRQPAGKIGLGNTPKFLMRAEFESVRMSRRFRLETFNAYCDRFSVPRIRAFSDLSDDPALVARLQAIYGDVDRLELLPGLFAQSTDEGVLLGALMARMVAYDALTQVYSNPLLSTHIYGAQTFTDYGLAQIEATTSLQDLAVRNTAPGVIASFEHAKGV